MSRVDLSLAASIVAMTTLAACGGSSQARERPDVAALIEGISAPQTGSAGWLPEPDVGPQEALALVEQGAFVLDVTPRERRSGPRVEGVTYIPIGELAGRIDEIPRERTVIVLCKAGRSSADATLLLRDSGYYDVRHLGARGNWVASAE